jgi:threonine/homoserine/homoserine lactone efflux protein
VRGFPLTLLLGVVVGFFGAIPPGPINVTIIRKASHGRRRDAYRVGLGGALVDLLLCGAIGLGFGWLLERLVTDVWVKRALALFLLGYGLKVLFHDAKRDERRWKEDDERGDKPKEEEQEPKDVLHICLGLLQGAANPAVFVNWTFAISFLVGHGLLKLTVPSAAGFALGVGIGVFGWFALLTELIEDLKDHPIGYWLRKSTVVAGVLLVLFGLYFTVRSMGDIGA